jgi:succinoglycan biosynthesis transport protein ExoP
LDYLGASEQQSELHQTRDALITFLLRRNIKRVGLTYVLDISFTSLDPGRAATIANAIADAYIVDQLEAKYQATRRASVWLQDRIRELRQQASDADRAVLDYKEKNKIVAVGSSSGGGPRLLGEQQLEELNSQLGAARAAAEEAKARLERINEVMKKDVPDATVADSLHNEVINRLRNQYLDIAAKEAIWSARYGSSHLAAVNLRTQMTEMRHAILDELGRIAQGYKSDYEITKTRIEGLERNLDNLVASSQVTNRDRLGLRDLESTAQVYHTIYDNFLQRYMEAIQQQSFPITEARVISAAVPPTKKSSPIASIVLSLAFAIGLIMSSLVSIGREAIDRVFRSTREVENLLKLKCIAVLPLLVPSLKDQGPKDARSRPAKHDQFTDMLPARVRAPKFTSDTVMDIDALSAAVQSGKISEQREFMRYVVEEPLSVFAESLRSVKVIADISGSKVIATISTLPKEGKSTVASNFAELIADTGKKTILLDADLRNPSLSRSLGDGAAKLGLLDVL